jgi:hypothetical protein
LELSFAENERGRIATVMGTQSVPGTIFDPHPAVERLKKVLGTKKHRSNVMKTLAKFAVIFSKCRAKLTAGVSHRFYKKQYAQ